MFSNKSFMDRGPNQGRLEKGKWFRNGKIIYNISLQASYAGKMFSIPTSHALTTSLTHYLTRWLRYETKLQINILVPDVYIQTCLVVIWGSLDLTMNLYLEI